jgi:hypothetical protein
VIAAFLFSASSEIPLCVFHTHLSCFSSRGVHIQHPVTVSFLCVNILTHNSNAKRRYLFCITCSRVFQSVYNYKRSISQRSLLALSLYFSCVMSPSLLLTTE